MKCLVGDLVVDISTNMLGGLSTLCFLEEVRRATALRDPIEMGVAASLLELGCPSGAHLSLPPASLPSTKLTPTLTGAGGPAHWARQPVQAQHHPGQSMVLLRESCAGRTPRSHLHVRTRDAGAVHLQPLPRVTALTTAGVCACRPSTTIVARTDGYTYSAKLWALSIVQAPLSVAPCQTLIVKSLYLLSPVVRPSFARRSPVVGTPYITSCVTCYRISCVEGTCRLLVIILHPSLLSPTYAPPTPSSGAVYLPGLLQQVRLGEVLPQHTRARAAQAASVAHPRDAERQGRAAAERPVPLGDGATVPAHRGVRRPCPCPQPTPFSRTSLAPHAHSLFQWERRAARRSSRRSARSSRSTST